MKNVFEATLKNRSSAHFAPVTITFPIPEDQYEQAILALKKSQIGDARVQDCLIDNVHAPNCPALVRMTGTMANVDELDWLGKQLESFDRYELLQFNAAVERFGLSAADELIDLSFCAREVTVVSDFNDLELVGKRHYRNRSGCSSRQAKSSWNARCFVPGFHPAARCRCWFQTADSRTRSTAHWMLNTGRSLN